MSIENNLESIAKSLAIIAEHFVFTTKELPPVTTLSGVTATLSPAPVAAPSPTPSFMTSATASAMVATLVPAPFTDHKGLMDYVMSVYKELGPVKGVEIQGILTKMKCTNINEVKPEQYSDFFADCEKLKVA